MPKPRALRRVEKLRRNAFLLDPALAQEEGAGGDVARERHLVGDNDHGTSFRRQALHHGQHFAHEFRVERGRRLVEEDYARMNRERPRNGGALLLAARKLARIGIGAMAEADFRQKRHRFFHSLGAGPSVNVDRRFDHIADDGHVVPQVEALEHHRDAAADAFDLPPVDAVFAFAEFEMLLADADLAADPALQED